MSINAVLEKLDRVKRTGHARGISCCPAHKDKSPSLAWRELDDGRVLLHCFAGCSVEEVLSAIGLTFDDLYPDKRIEHGRPLRKPFPASDVLEALAAESLIIVVAASAVAQGK